MHRSTTLDCRPPRHPVLPCCSTQGSLLDDLGHELENIRPSGADAVAPGTRPAMAGDAGAGSSRAGGASDLRNYLYGMKKLVENPPE